MVDTRRTSVWMATGPDVPTRPELGGEVRADVAVLGGGIVGITTALLLAEHGCSVALVEAGRLAGGVSGFTTAKVSSQHGLVYARLRSTFGAEAARTYGQANESALRWVADRVVAHDIDCDFRRQDSYVYVLAQDSRSKVEDEAKAAMEAGLPASLVDITPLPYPVAAAVRFAEQAEFHPRKYLLTLVEQLEAAGGRVFERSPAVEVDSGDPCRVKTAGGHVVADRVVMATHYPFLDRSLAFARVQPQRSYALACRVGGDVPPGMHISGDTPTRSVRAAPIGGEELLLVGGEGHRPGRGGDTEERYRRLETFAREHWDVRSVEYRWSSQDGSTVDGLPYVGSMVPWSDRVLMATGFTKWGMTGGTAAALLMSDLLRGRDHPAASLFDPNRLTPRASLRKLITENIAVAGLFVGDRLRGPQRSPEEIAPGDGGVVGREGKKVAAYRDDDGTLIAVSPRCTHLGCHVRWNRAERSWDCPCHGSRFAPDGTVLEGPAVRGLERVPLDRSG